MNKSINSILLSEDSVHIARKWYVAFLIPKELEPWGQLTASFQHLADTCIYPLLGHHVTALLCNLNVDLTMTLTIEYQCVRKLPSPTLLKC